MLRGVCVVGALVYASLGFASEPFDGPDSFRALTHNQGYQSDEEELPLLGGEDQHASFYMKHEPSTSSVPFDLETRIGALAVFDQTLTRAALAVEDGCPNWTLLPMRTDAGRNRARAIFRVLADFYAVQTNLLREGDPDRGVWSVRTVALGLSYRRACGEVKRAQDREEFACCCDTLCDALFWCCSP